MTGRFRAAWVVAVVALATFGEGGAAASTLLAVHLLLAAAIASAVLVFPAAATVPSRGPSTAWLVFAVLAAAGGVLAPYAYAAWLVLVEIVAFGSMAWLSSGAAAELARALPAAVAVLASAHSVAAVAQRIAGNPRPASTFLNPNHLGAWLVAATLILFGTIAGSETVSRLRFAYGGAGGLALAGIFVSGSRGALLGLAVGATALVAWSFGRLSPRARRATIAGAAGILLLAAAGVLVRFRTDADPYRFHRTRIWAASLGAAASAPWMGLGPGQFAAAAPNLNFALPNAPLNFERGFATPHSDVLRAVCEFGFPAGLAALGAVGLAAWEIFRRRETLSGVERGALAALAALAAQACVDDLTTRPAITMAGAALAGLIIARPRGALRSTVSRLAPAAVAGLIVLVLGVGEVYGYLAWNDMHILPHGRLDAGQLDRLHRSLSFNPLQPAAWQRLAEHFVGDGRSWGVADYAAAREAIEHARRLQPVDAVYARAAARVEATASLSIFPFQSTREHAARLYDDAFRMARTDATIPLEAAKFLLMAGDAAGARRAATQALSVEPRAATPRLCLAQAILREEGAPGAERARRLLTEALALAARDGEVPSSSYDAALRSVDPRAVEALRRELPTPETP